MNYENCVKLNGKKYCWNSETKTVDEITVKQLELSKCPVAVLSALMTMLDEKTVKHWEITR